MVNKIVALFVTCVAAVHAKKRLLHDLTTDGSHDNKCFEWDYYMAQYEDPPNNPRDKPPGAGTIAVTSGHTGTGQSKHSQADAANTSEDVTTPCTETVPSVTCTNLITDANVETKCYRYQNGYMHCCTATTDVTTDPANPTTTTECAGCAVTTTASCFSDRTNTHLLFRPAEIDTAETPANTQAKLLTCATDNTPVVLADAGAGTPASGPLKLFDTVYCTIESTAGDNTDFDRQYTFCHTAEVAGNRVGACCTQNFKKNRGIQGGIHCTPIATVGLTGTWQTGDGHVEFTMANDATNTQKCQRTKTRAYMCSSTDSGFSATCFRGKSGSTTGLGGDDCVWTDLSTLNAFNPATGLDFTTLLQTKKAIGTTTDDCEDNGCRTVDEDVVIYYDENHEEFPNTCEYDGGPGGLGALIGIVAGGAVAGGASVGLLFGGIIGSSGDGFPCDEWPTCIGPVPSAEYFLGPAVITILIAILMAPICYKCMKKDASYTFQLWALLPTIQNVVIILMRWMDDEDGNEYYVEVLTLRMFMVMVATLVWGIRLAMVHSYRHSFRGEDWRFKKMREEQEAKGGMMFPIGFFFNFLFTAMFNLILNLPSSYIGLMSIGVEDAFFFTDIIAIAVWAMGFIIETIADGQLTRHLKNPAPGAGKFLKSGLWKYSRHPNYFGEVLQWWGLWTFALGMEYGGYVTVLSPIMVTLMLAVKTPMMDVKYANDPEFCQYKKETSGFMPFISKKTGVQVLGAVQTPTPEAAAAKVEDAVAEEGGQSQEIMLVGRN